MRALGLQLLALNALVGANQRQQLLARLAQRLDGRMGIAANGRKELGEEPIALFVQLLQLSRHLRSPLRMVQIELLVNQRTPTFQQLLCEVQFHFVGLRNQSVKTLMQLCVHRTGMCCNTGVHPHVAGVL